MYNERFCAPYNKNSHRSCLSKNMIHKLAQILSINKNHKSPYDEICNIMRVKYNCNTEPCWTTIKNVKRKLTKKQKKEFMSHFRPMLPKDIIKNPKAWLSNIDIDDACKQYENNIKDFIYFKASPIDFRKCSVDSKLCRFDLQEYKNKGYNRLGFVFNTDESSKPGKHWISMYVDVIGKNLDNQPGIYFFDSFGNKPEKEILGLINKINKKKEFIVSYNNKCHQKNTYACGFYCLHFLEHMIKGHNFKKYNSFGLNDSKIKQYVNKVYLHPRDII